MRKEMLVEEMKNNIKDLLSFEEFKPFSSMRTDVKINEREYMEVLTEEIAMLLDSYGDFEREEDYIEELELALFQAMVKVSEKEIIIQAFKHKLNNNIKVRNCIENHSKVFSGNINTEFDMSIQLAKLEAVKIVLTEARRQLQTISREEAEQKSTIS